MKTPKIKNNRTRQRRKSGSMLVLVGALILTFVIVFLVFTLNYSRLLGAHQQQRTAIEAAALAGARDLSSIVVDDPNFGLIGLSDLAPTQSGSLAADGYCTSVQSINTLLATVRLDSIIADQFNDAYMRQLAQRDYTNALQANDRLKAALVGAVSGQQQMDVQGNVVDVMKDASSAYESNSIRMVGQNKTSLVAGSFTLSLGCIASDPIPTSVPQPPNFAQMSDSQQQDGCYLPYHNVSYKNENFVFAAVAADTHLVDRKNVIASVPGLPYQTPTVLTASADEQYKQTDASGQLVTRTVHAAASAEPGCMTDNLPYPGALQLTFTAGRPAVVGTLDYLLSSSQVNSTPTDFVMSPSTDDAPPAVLSQMQILPGADFHPNFGVISRVALYDWIRRARTKPNLQSLATAFSTPLTESQPQNSAHAIYLEFQSDGSIATRSAVVDPGLYSVVSQNQYFAVTGLSVRQGNITYDLIVKDHCYQPGRSKGGKHAGEPFGINGPMTSPTTIVPGSTWVNQGIRQMQKFSTGGPTGTVRPTYNNPGTAVEFEFRQRS